VAEVIVVASNEIGLEINVDKPRLCSCLEVRMKDESTK
jgi:hypothetical protein